MLLSLFIKSFIAALTSGLGGLMLYYVKCNEVILKVSVILASILMLLCSVVLGYESMEIDGESSSIIYIIFGIVFMYILNRCLEENIEDDFSMLSLKGKNGIRSLMIIISMCLHSIGEGISVGVSATSESYVGLFVIISLAIHNIPEGMALSLILRKRGMSVLNASFYSFVSNLPQPLMAIPAYIFMDYFRRWLSMGLGFASGSILYIVVFELIPECL